MTEKKQNISLAIVLSLFGPTLALLAWRVPIHGAETANVTTVFYLGILPSVCALTAALSLQRWRPGVVAFISLLPALACAALAWYASWLAGHDVREDDGFTEILGPDPFTFAGKFQIVWMPLLAGLAATALAVAAARMLKARKKTCTTSPLPPDVSISRP